MGEQLIINLTDEIGIAEFRGDLCQNCKASQPVAVFGDILDRADRFEHSLRRGRATLMIPDPGDTRGPNYFFRKSLARLQEVWLNLIYLALQPTNNRDLADPDYVAVRIPFLLAAYEAEFNQFDRFF